MARPLGTAEPEAERGPRGRAEDHPELAVADLQHANLSRGDVLVVHIDHSCAMKNVPDWARGEGHNVEVEEVADGEWEVIIEKNK